MPEPFPVHPEPERAKGDDLRAFVQEEDVSAEALDGLERLGHIRRVPVLTFAGARVAEGMGLLPEESP
jgi:hypothetical protein